MVEDAGGGFGRSSGVLGGFVRVREAWVLGGSGRYCEGLGRALGAARGPVTRTEWLRDRPERQKPGARFGVSNFGGN